MGRCSDKKKECKSVKIKGTVTKTIYKDASVQPTGSFGMDFYFDQTEWEKVCFSDTTLTNIRITGTQEYTDGSIPTTKLFIENDLQ